MPDTLTRFAEGLRIQSVACGKLTSGGAEFWGTFVRDAEFKMPAAPTPLFLGRRVDVFHELAEQRDKGGLCGVVDGMRHQPRGPYVLDVPAEAVVPHGPPAIGASSVTTFEHLFDGRFLDCLERRPGSCDTGKSLAPPVSFNVRALNEKTVQARVQFSVCSWTTAVLPDSGRGEVECRAREDFRVKRYLMRAALTSVCFEAKASAL